MIASTERRDVIRWVADLVPAASGDGCVRVGIDGPDASGKTTFAEEVAAVLRSDGRPVVRVSLDDFHHPRAVRYQAGRQSPEGFWRHAFDTVRFRRDVLDPFGAGGSRRYRPAALDLATDTPLEPEPLAVPPAAVLVVDGLFLHRDELVAAWDLSVYLAVPFTETVRRMAARDGTPPDPEDLSVRRYVQAHRIYVEACDPRRRAGVVIDNEDVDAPRVLQR